MSSAHRFAREVIRFRWFVVLVTVITIACAANGVKDLRSKSDYRVYFGPNNPQRIAFEELENTFIKNDNLLIVVEPGDGKIFSTDTLSMLEDITERAWQIPYSNRVDSLTNFQHSYSDGDALVVQDLVKNAAKFTPADLDNVERIALNEPLLRDAIVNHDTQVSGVLVIVQFPGVDTSAENGEVVAFTRRLASDIETQYPGTNIYLSGMVLTDNAFVEATRADLRKLIPLSFALMLALLALFVGSVPGTFATLLVLAFSFAGALGFAGYIKYPLTPVLAIAPIIILTVAIANCVHILTSYSYARRQVQDRDDAMIESLRINLQPVCIASVTTAIGFLSLNFSEVPPFQHLGSTVAIGVLISMLLSIGFLPALVSILPTRGHPNTSDKTTAMTILGDFVVAKHRTLLWGMSALILILVANVPRNELDDKFIYWFDKSMQFRQDADFTLANLTGLYTSEYVLRAQQPGGISEPAFLREVAAFSDWMRSQGGVRHVRTVTDIIMRLNMNLHGDDPSMYRLPSHRELGAQYLLLYEMSLPYGLDLNDQINVDKSAVRVTVRTDVLSSQEVIALASAAAQWLQDNAPHIDALPASGTTVMFAHIGHRNIRAMLLGTTIALGLISFVLLATLRSVKIGIISLIPNLVPAAMGFGIWGILVGEVGLSLSIVMSMTLGIVVDDTVHFLSKYLRARREQGLDAADAIRYAFTTVGRALLVTSIILIAGFAMLAQSSYAANASMGLMTAIVIAFALIADFFFLPALLMRVDRTVKPSRYKNHSI